MQTTSNYFNVLNHFDMKIDIHQNPYNLPIDSFFQLAGRVNPKRSFLFVSKLLGKHLAVQPDVPKLSGHLLANVFLNKHYREDVDSSILVEALKTGVMDEIVKNELLKRHTLSKKSIFIGFAETGTGLGHAVFSRFKDSTYIHTTREELKTHSSIFNFQEEHSHATDHLCYLNNLNEMEEAEEIILIDDEITTGKTTLNLIRSINAKFPGKSYVLLSLLDWRSEEHLANYEAFSKELGAPISVYSLLNGNFELNEYKRFEETQVFASKTVILGNHTIHLENDVKLPVTPYRVIHTPFAEREEVISSHRFEKLLLQTGRFGVNSTQDELFELSMKRTGKMLSEMRKEKNTLCIGAGELIYIPSRIASYMGEGITYKSSTRSPIFAQKDDTYPIEDKLAYQLESIDFYLYNIGKEKVKEVFFFFESKMPKETLEEINLVLKAKNVKNVTFVFI